MDKNNIHKTNSSFWDNKGNEVIGTTALPKYGAFVSEEKCHLFGDVSGKKLLEIGCGTGHSLKYLGDRKASELWGIDISEKQIEKAREYLSLYGFFAKLICSPMEEDCGIPVDYFEYVYSIYGVGWTTDLEGGAISLSDRKISTYINALTKAESDDEIIQLYKDSDYAKKAKMLPITFVIKARKL